MNLDFKERSTQRVAENSAPNFQKAPSHMIMSLCNILVFYLSLDTEKENGLKQKISVHKHLPPPSQSIYPWVSVKEPHL